MQKLGIAIGLVEVSSPKNFDFLLWIEDIKLIGVIFNDEIFSPRFVLHLKQAVLSK